MAKGELIDLRYRFQFHLGDAKQAQLDAAFEPYAKRHGYLPPDQLGDWHRVC